MASSAMFSAISSASWPADWATALAAASPEFSLHYHPRKRRNSPITRLLKQYNDYHQGSLLVSPASIACLDFSLQKTKMQLGVQVLVTDPRELEKIRQRYLMHLPFKDVDLGMPVWGVFQKYTRV
ncbi:unnamed protein product [Cuscuta campestris]|uniref:Uncharacterized protein n=1 Tax=Cuscuta campestris TaxID=132261 RepID=A0A484LHP4_9ASTE|nr:unnamed protein product [Cuscuta campestris]